MGWFSDAFNGVFGGGGDTAAAIAPAIIQGGASLLAGGVNQDANTAAAGQAGTADAASRDAMAAGGARAIGDLNTGLSQSAPVYSSEIAAGSPGTSYLQSLVGRNPYSETPAATLARSDLATSENNSLANSGLRGSGRAVAGVMNDTLSRFDANNYSQNQAASMGAAGTLSNLYAQGSSNLGADYQRTAGATAGIDSGVGLQAANSLQSQGDTLGRATAANGKIGGQMIGTLGSIIAGDTKSNALQQPAGNGTLSSTAADGTRIQPPPRYTATAAGQV